MENLLTKNETQKKQNFIVRLWNYFTTYEKIWMFVLFSAGITLSILFPEERGWLRIFEIITLIGGCTCELLVSKQSKWCFIVSFFFYDLTMTVVYIANGYYVSALFEIIFWMPILLVSFFSWEKRQDEENGTLTKVKEINIKKDLAIFISVLAASFVAAAIFTSVGFFAEGMSEYWYLDAIANTFSVCNGLFLWLRYKEQWIAWYGVCILEAIMWILSGSWVMLILTVGYITNTTYGLIKWHKYIKKHETDENFDADTITKDNNKATEKETTETISAE